MFQFDNMFFRIMGKITDCILCSLFWLICCIPIVTIGASTAALYYTVHKVLKGQRGYVFRSFFYAFRDNLKTTWIYTVIAVLVFIFVLIDKEMMYNLLKQGSDLGMLYYFFWFMQWFVPIVFIMGCACSARFELTWKAVMKNGMFLAIAYLPKTILMMVVLAVSAIIFLYSPFFILLLPVGCAWLFDKMLEPQFRKMMTPEERKEQEAMEEISKNAKKGM